MTVQGSKYTDEQRRNAAVQYAIEGNLRKIERDTGIPNQTLSGWGKCEWWQEIVVQVRAENVDSHIALYSRLTEKALKAAEKGIDELEGETLKAADIKALTVTGATATDKTRLLLNQPTSISSNSAGLNDLAAQFKALSENHKRIEDSVVSTVSESDKSAE